MGNRPRVTVLGSLNMDISVTVPRLPEPGATVLGSAARFTPGGKGANQAVAAARLGADVRMAGRGGGGRFRPRPLAAPRREGVRHPGVAGSAGAPAGPAAVAAGARHAVVAAGAHGAALAGPDGTGTVGAFRVDAVDTVGAGDTFVGALAVALAAGIPAAEAVRAAAAAAATAATRPGAQAGMPRPGDIRAATGLTWPVSPQASDAHRCSRPGAPGTRTRA